MPTLQGLNLIKVLPVHLNLRLIIQPVPKLRVLKAFGTEILTPTIPEILHESLALHVQLVSVALPTQQKIEVLRLRRLFLARYLDPLLGKSHGGLPLLLLLR